MTKTVFALVIGAAGLLISCEPLPSYPPPGYQPPNRTYGPQPDPNAYGQNYQGQRNPNAPLYGQNYDPNGANDFGSRPPAIPPGPPTIDPAPPVVVPKQDYPVAERTANPNQVLSPYSPYNVIDVEGFRAGQLAKDPSNGKIFRVP